ncbi:unnamed protein product, partial [Prorocentrum cordatum]
ARQAGCASRAPGRGWRRGRCGAGRRRAARRGQRSCWWRPRWWRARSFTEASARAGSGAAPRPQ